VNTVLAPLYWELVEPVEGQLDFTLVDGLIAGARTRGLQLAFLWFGTLKNAYSSYAPGWVKSEMQRFPRAECLPGQPCLTLSVLGEETLACDARAFAAVMRRIREVDTEHTVLMMQVENEPGLLGASRDRSATAEAAFAETVPEELLAYLAEHHEELQPEMAHIWSYAESRQGNWAQGFGRYADELFMAWHVARFLERVAAAGRTEYDIPMFANAWLKQRPDDLPGSYPSGGPVSTMLDVWRAAAPHLDFFAPDIYSPAFRQVCAEYTRPGNPLFIPEMHPNPGAASRALYAIGQHQALGCSPFGIEDMPVDCPLSDCYALLSEMTPLLSDVQGVGRMAGFLQQADDEEWSAALDGICFQVAAHRPLDKCAVPGGALLIALGEQEFVIAGYNIRVTFRPLDATQMTTELLWLDAGNFIAGKWHASRRLNGDESGHGTGFALGDTLTTCRFKVHCF